MSPTDRLRRANANDVPDGVQIRHLGDRIRLQVAAFGPFIPGINDHDAFFVQLARKYD